MLSQMTSASLSCRLLSPSVTPKERTQTRAKTSSCSFSSFSKALLDMHSRGSLQIHTRSFSTSVRSHMQQTPGESASEVYTNVGGLFEQGGAWRKDIVLIFIKEQKHCHPLNWSDNFSISLNPPRNSCIPAVEEILSLPCRLPSVICIHLLTCQSSACLSLHSALVVLQLYAHMRFTWS